MSSYIWGKPDGHTSMKYSNQTAGFVQPAFVSHAHWQQQYEEESKEAVLNPGNGYPDHIAPGVHGAEEGSHDSFDDGEYGELEVTIRFRGRTGSSIRSKRLKLTSSNLPTVLKLENPNDGFLPSHRVFSPQTNQSLCISDEETGCACREFSPSIFQELLGQTLGGAGLSIDPTFDHRYSCVSDLTTDELRPRQVSNAQGKKRLYSNASEDNSHNQPNKKNPRLAAAADEADNDNDGDGDGERHTCPYFKMYPEKHLECGTKDLAQRPKIKSHIIKDHLKKSGIPVPPEIKSQKCEPWDRWCKYIVADSPKSDRPVPNSTPDFYPILNYVVTAASKIPSDGLTCFSSVILRLFKSVQASPNDWVPFITGLEELERSLNVTGPAGALPVPRRHPPSKDDDEDQLDQLAIETEDPTSNSEVEKLKLDVSTLNSHCTDLSALSQFPTSATTSVESLPPSAYDLTQHPSTTFTNIPEPSPISMHEDFSSHNHNALTHSLYQQQATEYVDFPRWIDLTAISDPTSMHQDQRAVLEPEYYDLSSLQQVREQQPEPPLNHFSIPPGIGTNSKSCMRVGSAPRIRKRKHGSVRSHHVEGQPLNDGTTVQKHVIEVGTPASPELGADPNVVDKKFKYEFSGRFSISHFLEWLRTTFNFSFDNSSGDNASSPTDERVLWCVDSREDIRVTNPDGIKAHLKSWQVKGSFPQDHVPAFRVAVYSARVLGMDKYSMFTPDFVEMIQDGGINLDDDMSSLLMHVRPGSTYH